ncbi:hypothetical protein [Acaricomes phytoseiuli]|uniref:hypothetical protein n=1 Tax=Acaricomes phytoseiuli TaxID=291968 RepID=UPI000361848D|nr:hypothetical protein [Acaricomes phytoseiuli]
MMVDAEERFWNKVVKDPAPHGCWYWIGAVADDGYGRYTLNANNRTVAVRPHRYAYALATGQDIRKLSTLMHVCDMPLCVRATADTDTHLLEGDARLNMLDRRKKGRDRNGSGSTWRGQARTHFAARSRALRNEIRDHGLTRPTVLEALRTGDDPSSPVLF